MSSMKQMLFNTLLIIVRLSLLIFSLKKQGYVYSTYIQNIFSKFDELESLFIEPMQQIRLLLSVWMSVGLILMIAF